MRDRPPLSDRCQSPIPNNKQALTGATDAGTDAEKRMKIQSVPCLLVILMSAQEAWARGRGHINNRPASEQPPPVVRSALKTCARRARHGALACSRRCARELPSKPTKSACQCVSGQLGPGQESWPLQQLPLGICSFVVSMCPSTRFACMACAISWYADTEARSSVRHRPACAGTGG